jgi:hypothetical protein
MALPIIAAPIPMAIPSHRYLSSGPAWAWGVRATDIKTVIRTPIRMDLFSISNYLL